MYPRQAASTVAFAALCHCTTIVQILLYHTRIGLAVGDPKWHHSHLKKRHKLRQIGVPELNNIILNLHQLVFYACVMIVAIVFGAMIYSIFAYRKSKDAGPGPFYHSVKAELVWTGIPLAIFVGMSIPSFQGIIGIQESSQPSVSEKIARGGTFMSVVSVALADDGVSSGATVSQETQMTSGTDLYRTSCAACHQNDGEGMPPTFPSLVGGALTTGDLAAHIDIVLNGKPGTTMLGFASTLTDSEIAAIITYERNAWGNDSGDSVVAADIAAAR